jgi:hypothetical protein
MRKRERERGVRGKHLKKERKKGTEKERRQKGKECARLCEKKTKPTEPTI